MVFGLMLFVAVGVSAACAMVTLCHANPHTPVPWLFGWPPRVPGKARVLFGLAGGACPVVAVLLFDTLGYWVVALIVGGWIGVFAVQHNHNRSVRSR